MTKTERIKKTTLSDQVSQAIKEKIKSDEWEAGSRIPSESVLAQAFGVNRLTVRNALQKLNAIGIVETRAGEGTYVKQFDLLEYINEMSDLVTSPEILDGVMDFRRCVELECGRLAIERADEADIKALERAYLNYKSVSKQKKPFEEHVNDLVNADLDFHIQVCKLSKNSLFILAYSAVRELMFRYVKSVFINRYLSYKVKNNDGPNIDMAASAALKTHNDIFMAIKNKDFTLYEKTYIKMIDYENLE